MKYKSPKLTADGIIVDNGKILLIRRKSAPFKGKWALPGGFVEYNERVENATIREVFEETGLKTKIVDLVGIYSDPDRDPRGHIVTVVYLDERQGGDLKAGDDAAEAKFFEISQLPELSFDHDIIIKDFLRRKM